MSAVPVQSRSLEDLLAARDAAARARYADAPGKTQVIDPDHYHEQVLRDRAERYAAHVAQMTIDPDMALFAMAMSARFGAYVQVHHFVADWLTALLILRYGEECDPARAEPRNDGSPGGWPLAFDATDRQRAMLLLQLKKWPGDFVTLLDDASHLAREKTV